MLVTCHRSWGEQRVYYHDEAGQLCTLPLTWTSKAPEDLFVSLSGGHAAFRVTDLQELSRLLASLDRGSSEEGSDGRELVYREEVADGNGIISQAHVSYLWCFNQADYQFAYVNAVACYFACRSVYVKIHWIHIADDVHIARELAALAQIEDDPTGSLSLMLAREAVLLAIWLTNIDVITRSFVTNESIAALSYAVYKARQLSCPGAKVILFET